MQSQAVFNAIKTAGIVAGMRGDFPPEVALKVTQAVMTQDFNVFEFTMNSVEPIAAMQAVKREYGDAVCAGMGTVLDVETAKRALDAGADFIVSPAFQADVVETVVAADVLMAPGVITATEAVAAWSKGVKVLKLFPIGPLGVDYFKTLAGPLDHMHFMCNGGTHGENVMAFLKAGAVACGVFGWLTGNGSVTSDVIGAKARQLRQAVNMARGIPREI